MSELLAFDTGELDEGYYDAMRADITSAHNAVGGFIVGQEAQGDNDRTIEVRDLTPNAQRLEVHVRHET